MSAPNIFTVFERMPFAKYNEELEGLRASALKHALVSGLLYSHAGHTKKDNDTLREGRAGHTAILEVERFLAEYAQFETRREDGTKRIRSGKEWIEFLNTNSNKTILTPEQFQHAMALRDAVRDHPIAGPLVKGFGRNELSLQWRHERTGELLKARLDRITKLALVDIKTTADPGAEAFARVAFRLNYFMQMALYSDGAEACGLGALPVKIIAVQNRAPYDVVVYDVEQAELDFGRDQYNRAIDTVLACRKANAWPGQATVGSLPLRLPAWAAAMGDSGQITFGGEEI